MIALARAKRARERSCFCSGTKMGGLVVMVGDAPVHRAGSRAQLTSSTGNYKSTGTRLVSRREGADRIPGWWGGGGGLLRTCSAGRGARLGRRWRFGAAAASHVWREV